MHLTLMNAVTRLSSRGQVVIPKDVRVALGWPEGQELRVARSGSRIILEPLQPERERISWEEFRRRVPKYEGPPVSIEEMDEAVGRMFEEKYKREE
jgi:AbrB family looped-hinge helix DNA binding protein